ncbi:nickel/cobalt transporter [Hwanghaeella grinnelliae]|nr:high frequency lysogenization protein HflD [Hwanghaeella grinnelliae]
MNNPKTGLLVVSGLVVLAALFLIVTAMEPGSWYDSVLVYAQEKQRAFTRDFGESVTKLSDARDIGPFLALVGLGFAYGIFHAVGPGHGKAIISTYALTHETHIRRTAAIAFASAMVQGMTAIAAVVGIAMLVEGSMRRAALAADDYLEPISYAAVTMVGLYLIVKGGRQFLRMVGGLSHQRQHRHDHHSHSHEAHDHQNHHHHHDHDDACCGHSHGPSPDQVAKADSLTQAAMVALSVGIRPCSGAILVLVLTYSTGMLMAGVAAVLAMSVGTGLTVAGLAMAAHGMKFPLMRLAEGGGIPMAPLAAGAALLGGGVVTAIGAGLLYGTMNAASHPLL